MKNKFFSSLGLLAFTVLAFSPGEASAQSVCGSIVKGAGGIGVDLCSELIQEWAKNVRANGAGLAQANTVIDVTTDEITNLSNFFGEKQINLNAEAANQKAYARLKVDFEVGTAGAPSKFIANPVKIALVDLNCLVVPCDETQFAKVEYQIFVKGFLIAGKGAAGPFADPAVIKQTPLISLLAPLPPGITPPYPGEQLVMSTSLDPSDVDSTYLFSPEWAYWKPLLESGSTSIDDAWDEVQLQLDSQSYIYANIAADTAVQGFEFIEKKSTGVPAPMPIFGSISFFYYSRKLRERIKLARTT